MPKRMKTERKKHVLKSKIFTILVQVFHPYITILKKTCIYWNSVISSQYFYFLIFSNNVKKHFTMLKLHSSLIKDTTSTSLRKFKRMSL